MSFGTVNPASDVCFESSFSRLHDPDVQSLLDSLDVETPQLPRLPVTSPYSNPLTPPLTPLSPQLAPAVDMLQSMRDTGLPPRGHSVGDTSCSPIEERQSSSGASYSCTVTSSTSSVDLSSQLSPVSCMRGVLVYLPKNLPGNMRLAGQLAFVDTVQPECSTIRLLNRPIEQLQLSSCDLPKLTLVSPIPGDNVKMIRGRWAGYKGRLLQKHSATSDVELTTGNLVSVSTDHLAKYYGKGCLTVAPNTLSSNSPTPNTPNGLSSYSPVWYSNVQPAYNHAQNVQPPVVTPPSPSPSPSTPTGTYSSNNTLVGYIMPPNSQHILGSPSYTSCQYGVMGMQLPPRTQAACPPTPKYMCSQTPVHTSFYRGAMEFKKQFGCPCKQPSWSQSNAAKQQQQQQQRQRLISSVDKLLEALLKRPSPPALSDTIPEVHSTEVVTSSMKISTLCPITKQRMQYPCRGRFCKHLQCFDAKPFLELGFKRICVHKTRPSANVVNSWKCPVCSKVLQPQNLCIDKVLMKIIHDSKATELEHKGNNQWEPIEKHKSAEVIDLTADSDSDDD